MSNLAEAIRFEDNGFSTGAKSSWPKQRLTEMVGVANSAAQEARRRRAAHLIEVTPFVGVRNVKLRWSEIDDNELTHQKIQLFVNAHSSSLLERKPELEHVNAQLAVERIQVIALHNLLEYGSLILASILALSLGSWWIGNESLVIVTPFPAMTGLAMCPFLFAMGRASRRPK